MTVVPRCGPADRACRYSLRRAAWMPTPDAARAMAGEGLPQLSANSLQKPIPLSQIDAADNVAVARASKYRGG